VALLDEVAKSKGILVSVTTGESLVCHVEEGVVATLLHSVTDGPPLLLGGINTSGVVCASVQQDDAVLGHLLDVLNHALEVEANGVLVVISVLLHLQAGIVEDCIVVGPRGGGDVDGLCSRVVSLEESTTYPQGTSAGDGLGDGDSAFFERSGLGAVGEQSGSLGEVGDTGDAGVLLVEVLLDHLLLGLLHGGQDIGLSLVVTVCADT